MITSFRNRAAAMGVAALASVTLLWAAQPKTGDSFPDLKQFELEGTLPDLKGKVVLVDFWASWCAPCKESFPVMQELVEKFGSKGLVIVAVSVDEERKDLDNFVKNYEKKSGGKVPFTIVRDAKQKLVGAVSVDKMPTSFLLDASRNVKAVHTGFYKDKTRKEYLQEIGDTIGAAK
jgi:thiol-disulfide isomerase/thioredoxin